MGSVNKFAIRLLPGFQKIREQILPQYERNKFIIAQLNKLPDQSLILDAGCGSQPYRENCIRLNYKAQDFGQYITDVKTIIGTTGLGGRTGYEYGHLDYVGDIWKIDEKDKTFDAILCTEVFEHIPKPNETVKEFGRLLKPGGILILTAPSNCLRHMDPYFFYSGFSEHWYETILAEHGFSIEVMEAAGDYFSWLALEIARTATSNSLLAKIMLAPAFLYYLLKNRTAKSIDTLCAGYHVVATKKE